MTKVSGYRYSDDVLLGGQNIFNSGDLLEFRSLVGMPFQRPNPFPKSIMDNMVANVHANKRWCRAKIHKHYLSSTGRSGALGCGQGAAR
uniref:T1308a n=1 Tax=Mycobacterium leprae TaxID=1769 RepID=Q49676_MYCLR|nr:t1308a [Mycobacterium leprae]